MFDKVEIQDKLRGLVGFKTPLDPDFFALTSDNTESRSGYFYNDNPYAKLQALRDCQDYANIDEAQFNNLLERINDNAVISVCNAVFNNSNTPSFVDRQKLYKYASNKANIEEGLTNGFVGHRFYFDNKPNVTAEITSVTLEFQGSGNIELLLYNTQNLQPVESKIVEITSDNQEVKLNWKMKSNNGDYYLGYIYDGTLKPYKRNYELSIISSKITYLHHFRRAVKGFTGGALWDLNSNDGTSATTGLNPDITVYNDWTGLITQNENLFGNAIYLEGAIQFLNTIQASLRSNKTQRISEQQLIAIKQEIEGQDGANVVKVTGLRPSLNSQITLIGKRIDQLRKGYFGGRIKTVTLY